MTYFFHNIAICYNGVVNMQLGVKLIQDDPPGNGLSGVGKNKKRENLAIHLN